MNHFLGILVAAMVVISIAAYQKDYPEGKHISEAAQKTDYLGQKEIVDKIFADLENKYFIIFKLNGISYTMQEKIAEPKEEPSAAPSPAVILSIPPPPPPRAKDANLLSVKRPRGIGIPGIVLTVNPDGTYRIHKKPVESGQLEARLNEIFEAKRDKTIYFRFLRPVKNYEEIVNIVVLLKGTGVENPIPIITPQIKDIVWEEFKGTISLPILNEEIYAQDDGTDPEQVMEEDFPVFGVEGGVEGGVLGGVVGGVLGVVADEVEAPVRAMGDVKPPKLLKKVSPVYPEIALKARVEGVVIIEVMTDIYGRVVSYNVLRSIPLLDQAAIDAVKQWSYEPLLINSKPRMVIFTVMVRFTLPE